MVELAIVIPVKRLDEAKSRLAEVLDEEHRQALMRELIGRVATAARGAACGPIWIATSDPAGTALAADLGVDVVSDGGLAWNQGLEHARRLLDPAPERVLYLAGDLPLVTAEEVRELASTAPARGVVIGRARDGGTNALLVSPADALTPRFGEHGSAAVHRYAALAAGLEVVILDLPGVALDIDTPKDIEDAGLPLPATSPRFR
jgi:2-phospho-L-lactate/phosphoenolpyruvate guanylyltransferase